mgnify:CR=1 FL=1
MSGYMQTMWEKDIRRIYKSKRFVKYNKDRIIPIINNFVEDLNQLLVKFTADKNIKSAIKDSDLVIIHTEWNDFKTINFNKDVSNKKFILFDMRNIYSPAKMKDLKINYFGVGH